MGKTQSATLKFDTQPHKNAQTVRRVWKNRASDISCVCSRHRTTIEWAESHNFPPFSQAKMEDTRFVDLKVKVGFPYLYCHQGDCEHLVIITDIRLVLVLLHGLSSRARSCFITYVWLHCEQIVNRNSKSN